MANVTTDPRFYAALQQALQASPVGPINSSAFLQDRDLAMAKAGTLLSYQSYLAQARSWKAARKTVPLSFEREVQAQAAQALSDTRDLAMSALRMISQMKQAEQLDRIMDFAIAGIHAGGPAQIKDLWAHVANDPSARQAMKDQGLTDDLFAAMNDAMSKMDGQLYLKGGKLAMDVTATGQDEVRSVVFKRSAAGQPSNLHDLLTRGQFESMVDQFSQPGAVPLDLMTGAPGDLEMADSVLAGSLQIVQLVAQHKRKLEDTGLETYAGNDPGTLAVLVAIGGIGLLTLLLGAGIMWLGCPSGPLQNRYLCDVGTVLYYLGWAAFIVGFGPPLLALGVGIIFALHDGNYAVVQKGTLPDGA
jgi:hypothetical protein